MLGKNRQQIEVLSSTTGYIVGWSCRWSFTEMSLPTLRLDSTDRECIKHAASNKKKIYTWLRKNNSRGPFTGFIHLSDIQFTCANFLASETLFSTNGKQTYAFFQFIIQSLSLGSIFAKSIYTPFKTCKPAHWCNRAPSKVQ